jgi:fumarate hydratase subunit beta
MENVKELKTPLTNSDIENLQVGDRITLTGQILTGRDAALPRLVKLIENGESPVVVEGAAIMHTAVSQAGIAPTSSNKTEIEVVFPHYRKQGLKCILAREHYHHQHRKH